MTRKLLLLLWVKSIWRSSWEETAAGGGAGANMLGAGDRLKRGGTAEGAGWEETLLASNEFSLLALHVRPAAALNWVDFLRQLKKMFIMIRFMIIINVHKSE